MDETAVVIVAPLATLLTAVAGFWFNNTRAREDRLANDERAEKDRNAARDLANDARQHERELAAQRHEREIAAQRAARYYEERRTAYRAVLLWALNETRAVQVHGLEEIGMPPPPPPFDDERWTAIMADVNLFGSEEVVARYEELRQTGIRFRTISNDAIQRMKVFPPATPESGAQLQAAITERENLRNEMTRLFLRLMQLMREELAAL